MNLDGEVLHEIIALDWSSHGQGATVPEVVGGLSVRGVLANVESVVPSVERLLLAGAIQVADRVVRGEWPVWQQSRPGRAGLPQTTGLSFGLSCPVCDCEMVWLGSTHPDPTEVSAALGCPECSESYRATVTLTATGARA